MSFSDADLIARALARDDENAFGELVRRYQSPVRGFLVKLTRGDFHLADDLAQETFLRGWRRLSTFRGDSRFETWLFGIAYNEFRMNIRKKSEVLSEELDETLPETLHSAAAETELHLDLNEALKRVTTVERAAIVLCCQNGLSHEEAARVLEAPVGTIKTNILRGKEKLRRLLAPAYTNYESD